MAREYGKVNDLHGAVMVLAEIVDDLLELAPPEMQRGHADALHRVHGYLETGPYKED